MGAMLVQWAEHCKTLSKAQSSAYARAQFAEYVVGLDREDAHIPLVQYNTRDDLVGLADSTGYADSYKGSVSLPRLAQAIVEDAAHDKHMQVRAFAPPPTLRRLAFVLRMLLAHQPCAISSPCR